MESSEKSPPRRISDKELMAGVRHIQGMLPIPYHEQLRLDLLLCGSDQNVKAIPDEVRNMARAVIRYRDRNGWPSLLDENKPNQTEQGL